MSKSFGLLLFTSFISTLGAGLFWTGFPVFLNDFGRNALDLSEIYAFATFGSLVFGLVGGIWSDLGDCKRIAIVSQLISAVCIAAVFVLWKILGSTVIMYALPLLYFNFSVGGIAETVWIMNFDKEAEVKSKILDRALVTFLAKLIGFSAGPVLFNWLSGDSLLVCSGFFAIPAVLQMGLKGGERSIGEAGIKVSLAAILSLAKSPAFVGATFLTGMLSIPMNPLFVTHMLQIGTAADVSWFWGLAGAAGLVNLILQKTGVIRFSRSRVALVTFGLAACVALAFATSDRNILLLSSALFVFGSILFSMHLYLRVGSDAVKSSLGSSFGLLNLLMDAGVFVGMLLGAGSKSLSAWSVIASVILLLAARAIATWRLG